MKIKRRQAMNIGNWIRTVIRDSRFLESENLPNALDITEIWDAVDKLWEASAVDGLERAATLVLNEQQHLVLLNHVIGSRRSVIPSYEVPEGCNVAGVFHTHPVVLGIAFGGADIAEALFHKHQISIVRSGNDIFAISRTSATSDVVDLDDVRAEGAAAIYAHRAEGRSQRIAVYLAALELCESYGLALYRGRGKEKLKGVFLP